MLGERVLSSSAGSDDEHPFRLDDRRNLVLSPEARGVVAVFDPTNRKLTIASDWLNYFPVYYWHSSRAFLFGSHLKQLSRLTGAAGDPAGIVEFLRANWCLNGRTVFEGIRRDSPRTVRRIRRIDRGGEDQQSRAACGLASRPTTRRHPMRRYGTVSSMRSVRAYREAVFPG